MWVRDWLVPDLKSGADGDARMRSARVMVYGHRKTGKSGEVVGFQTRVEDLMESLSGARKNLVRIDRGKE